MTDAINTNNRLKVPNQRVDNSNAGSSKSNASAKSNSPASAVVELTSEQVLKHMEQLPAVDSNRVEAIKTALANGEYQPDPEVIARKFSEIEKLLP